MPALRMVYTTVDSGLGEYWMANRTARIFACLLATAIGGCAGGSRPLPSTGPQTALGTQGWTSTAAPAKKKSSSPIQHVVVIIQENRSFDNLFQGLKGADTVSVGENSSGQSVPLVPVSLAAHYDIEHLSYDYFEACNGTGSLPGTDCQMNGFDLENYGGTPYGYVPHSETKPYFAMAKDYVVGDRMFTSHIDASFVSHQYIIAGQASSSVDLPSGAWGCGGTGSDTEPTLTQQRTYGPTQFPCFTNETLANELDSAGLSWRFYDQQNSGGDLNGYMAIQSIYNGPDWLKDVVPQAAQFITDVGSGTLADVTWITPSLKDSDHAGEGSKTGPDWVASLVNAVGESEFWDSTVVFIMWDEWGGWYDHVPPPFVDYDGLGMRVPLVVISPYAKKGYVSHVQYEHGSILRFIEDTFNLGRLAASDTRATSPSADCFNWSSPPRPFKAIKTKLKAAYFLHEPLDKRAADDE
jgi:phospholipase C